MERQRSSTSNDTIVAPASGAGPRRHRRDPRVGAGARAICSRRYAAARPLPVMPPCATSVRRTRRRSTAAWCCGFRLRPASPARTWPSCMSMAAAPWCARWSTPLLALPGIAAGRARRVRAPRVRERQARSHRGRRPGRSGARRDRGAAPSGAGAVARLAARALRVAGATSCCARRR